MPRLEVPLLHRMLYASGDLLLRAEIDLQLKDRLGAWHPETFRVDSGAEMTTMPAALAQQLGIPMPQHPVPNAVHVQTGLEFRSGILRVRVVGLDATEYVFPCFFLGNPQVAGPSSQSSTRSRTLLGLSGVITQLRFAFDGDPGAGAPYGYFIVEKK